MGTGWPAWTNVDRSWKDAIELPGSTYAALLGKILAGRNTTDIEKRWDLSDGKPLLAREGKLYIAYLENGGAIEIAGVPAGLRYTWIDPKTGDQGAEGKVESSSFTAPGADPWVLIVE